MVAGDKDAQSGWGGGVPGKEVLQVGRIEALAGIPDADENVGIARHIKPPIHTACIRKREDLMPFVIDEHLFQNRIAAELLPATVFALEAGPY